MYKVQEETNVKTLAECLRLGKLHYDEVFAGRKEQVPRNYNWQFLNLCLTNKLMHIVTAKTDEDELIGYYCALVSPDMLSSTFVATDLAIFVHPDFRGKGLFKDMLKFVEGLLTKNGVTSNVMKFQKGHSEKLPLHYGYVAREVVYEKILKE